MTVNRYPLQWPVGWPRTAKRKDAQFGTVRRAGLGYSKKGDLTNGEAVERVRYEVERLGVGPDDMVLSTNLTLNLSGFPRGDQREPADPGVALYWQQKNGGPMKVMAIDRYTTVRDNIAAIAATLEAMRAIERHGGGQVLERAFTGFDALPAPSDHWQVLGLNPKTERDGVRIRAAFKEKLKRVHIDAGGSSEAMRRLTEARDAALQEIGAA